MEQSTIKTLWSVIVNRKDRRNQRFWTEWRMQGVNTGGTPAQGGSFVITGPGGTIDPSLLPNSEIFVNGTAVPINGINSPNFNNTTPAAPVGYTNVLWAFDANGNISAAYATSGMAVPFSIITSGTNTIASMVVGSGASLTVACPSTGVIEATELATSTCTPVVTNLSAPTHAGQILISQPGNTTAVWADPQVQGLYAAGSTICPAPAYTPPTCIQPVLIGGATQSNTMENILVTDSGELVTLAQDQETDPNVQRFAATTGKSLVTNATPNLIPLLSITPKAGATTVTFTFRNLDFASTGLLAHFQLLKNATLTGASFQNVDPASSTQYDTAATSYAGGRLLDAGHLGGDKQRNDYELNFGFTGGTPDIITLVFAPTTGNSKSIAGCTFAWDEQAAEL
jgi:hypothetical protein